MTERFRAGGAHVEALHQLGGALADDRPVDQPAARPRRSHPGGPSGCSRRSSTGGRHRGPAGRPAHGRPRRARMRRGDAPVRSSSRSAKAAVARRPEAGEDLGELASGRCRRRRRCRPPRRRGHRTKRRGGPTGRGRRGSRDRSTESTVSPVDRLSRAPIEADRAADHHLDQLGLGKLGSSAGWRPRWPRRSTVTVSETSITSSR